MSDALAGREQYADSPGTYFDLFEDCSEIATKLAKPSAPSPAAEERQELQAKKPPNKKVKKPQTYDKEGHPHYVKPSDCGMEGEKADMLAMGLESTDMSPYSQASISGG